MLKLKLMKMEDKNVFGKIVNFIAVSIKKFNYDNCSIKASALTYYSLLSIVPLLAMAFGIAKGFGFEKKLKNIVINNLQGHEEIADKILVFSDSLLQNTQGSLLAGIGVLILFWTVIRLLGNIEKSFNTIWQIKKNRSFFKKVSNYLSLFLICPFLFIISSSMNVILTSKVSFIFTKFKFLEVFSFSIKLIPYGMIWIVFAFIYFFLPNKKVRFLSALASGIIAGTAYQLTQILYVKFQIGAVKYGAIYGSFAALPLFLIWLQISWLILFFGAEINFMLDNLDYDKVFKYNNISLRLRKKFALVIMYIVVKCFFEGKGFADLLYLSEKLGLPLKLIENILDELIESGLVSRVSDSEEKCFYQPACDLDKISIQYVLDKFELAGKDEVSYVISGEYEKMSLCLEKIANLLNMSEENVLLKNI